MYEGYWNLKEKPFENTADARFFYYSLEHEEALMRLIYVVREAKGGAVLIGDYGTGKTSLSNALLAELNDTRHYVFVFITNPLIGPLNFLKEIASQMGIEFTSQINGLEVKHLLESALRRNMEGGRHTVVIVDEAHLIQNQETWEELRLLLNIQCNNRFLLSLILMGQSRLAHTINELKQLKQRLSMRYYLRPLGEKETDEYINHRLKVAGSDKPMFTKEAIELIFSQSKGNPREINNICDMSLLVGCSKKVEMIDKNIVQEVIKDLEEVF